MSDFRCPDIDPPVDYLQVHYYGGVNIGTGYEIPRSCVEALGIDTSIIPPGGEERDAVFFTKEQTEKLRAHKHTHHYMAQDDDGVLRCPVCDLAMVLRTLPADYKTQKDDPRFHERVKGWKGGSVKADEYEALTEFAIPFASGTVKLKRALDAGEGAHLTTAEVAAVVKALLMLQTPSKENPQ